MTRDEIKEQIKKLLGIKPYEGTTNFLIGDRYLRNTIKEEWIKNNSMLMLRKAIIAFL